MFCYWFVDVVQIMMEGPVLFPPRLASCPFNNQVTSCFGLKPKQKEPVRCAPMPDSLTYNVGKLMASSKTARIVSGMLHSQCPGVTKEQAWENENDAVYLSLLRLFFGTNRSKI